ncbi:MAG TPA: flagellar basal body rod C-terminal domain-containing protein [Pseudogulbenkiania sp.]|nr:flagellar basal body rod C-terminal domain-containing protein [Pseudogulbenkiania sp.]
MISHARQFDLNVKLMQTSDQNEQKASQILAVN